MERTTCTEIKSTPRSIIVDSTTNGASTSVQHEQIAQPHCLVQLPSIARHSSAHSRNPPPVAPKPRCGKSFHEDMRQSSTSPDTSSLLAENAPVLNILATVTRGQTKAETYPECSGGQESVKPDSPSPRSKIFQKQQPMFRTKYSSASPIPPTLRNSNSSSGRKLSPTESLLVSTADMDHDEDSSSGSEVDLSGCLTVQEFVEHYSTKLPVNVIAIQDKLQRAYTIHGVEQRTVLRIEDKRFGNSFNLPIESNVKFGIVYNPHGNDREASHGYEFATVSDILKLQRFPAVVVVTKNFRCGSQSVKKHEVLIVREQNSQKTSSQRYLRVYSLLTNSTKDLPEQCAGRFSTNPSLLSLCALDIIQYVFPHPFPCQAVMYIPSNNQDTQIPRNLSNVLITISDSRIEKSLVASEINNTTTTCCIRVPVECSLKILPEITIFEECNHPSCVSGEVIYTQSKKKASQPSTIATGESDYELIPEETPNLLTESAINPEINTSTTLQISKLKGNKPMKKNHNPISALMQRTLRRRQSKKVSKSAPRPATHRDSAIAMTKNFSYIPTRAMTWPRQVLTSSESVSPTILPNGTADISGSDCDHYEPIPGGASLVPANIPVHHCQPEPYIEPIEFSQVISTANHYCEACNSNREDKYFTHGTSASTGSTDPTIFSNATTDTSDCDHYEPIPGDVLLQPANTTEATYTNLPVHHCQSKIEPSEFLQAIPNANDVEYEEIEIRNCKRDEKYFKSSKTAEELTCCPITPSSRDTQPSSSATPQTSSTSEPSAFKAKAAIDQHMIAKVIEEQLNYHREEILGRIQLFEDQLKHHREESLGWLQEHEGRLRQLQQPQKASNYEHMLPGISEYVASRDDFVAKDTNMQKIQSMFEHLTSQVNASYGEFRRRLDSFEQQLGQQQNMTYEYIASQFCSRLQSGDTESESQSQTTGQDLQKVHSMLEHLTLVTAQTGESMSESYVQFTKRLDSIEQRLEQQKDIYKPYHPDCQSKETALEPSLCTVQDNTSESADFPNETPPLNQPQMEQWIDVMTELHIKLEKQLIEQMESFEQKLTEQQNMLHSSLRQFAEQQSPAFCHLPQAASQGFQSIKPEPNIKEVAHILNGFCRLYELGIQLDISEAALDQIEHDHGSNIGKYRIKVISHWLKNAETPTWEVLGQALKDIEEHGLARRILEKYGEHA